MNNPAAVPVIQLRNRLGVALASTIFGLMVVSLITAGVWTISDLDGKAVKNREDAGLSQRLAQSAMTHALSLIRTKLENVPFDQMLRGMDADSLTTTDNGLFINYAGLGDSLAIPAAGKTVPGSGAYFVQIMDDPADTNNSEFIDDNDRILLRCTGMTTTGSRTVIDVIVRLVPQLPAVVMGGKASLGSTFNVTGACGNVHSNGTIALSGNEKTVNSWITSSGTPMTSGSATIKNAANQTITVATAPQMVIPYYEAADYCGTASYVLSSAGTTFDRAANLTRSVSYTENTLGWKRSGGSWVSNHDNVPAGTYCFEATSATIGSGNVIVGNAIAKDQAARAITIIATGSVEISGEANIKSHEPGGAVVITDWDLKIGSAAKLQGLVFARGYCLISGNLTLTGQLYCYNAPNTDKPAGAINYRQYDNGVPINYMSGQINITYGCGLTQTTDKYKISTWYQRLSM